MIPRALLALGACAAASAVVVTAVPGTASAFVRYRTSSGAGYAWRTTTVRISGYPHGLPSMTVDQITTAMSAAVGAWTKEEPTNALCSYLALGLTMQPVSALPPDAVHDDVNVIAIRDGSWTSICSTTKEGQVDCHQPGQLALTTVWSRTCGEIVEADLEVNADQSVGGLGFMWADLDAAGTGAKGAHDLQNALTHEMGHFIGLDHTCVLGAYGRNKNGDLIIPLDNLGNQVPICSAQAPIEPALRPTMYPSADVGDIDKRSLVDDDRQGLCAIYPLGTNPVPCGGGQEGCSVGAVAGASGDGDAARLTAWRWLVVGLAGLSLGLFATRRRRERLGRRRR